MSSKIDVALLMKDGLLTVGAEAFRLYTLSLVVAASRLTDGFISRRMVIEIVGDGAGFTVADELSAAGLWSPRGDGWDIVNYLKHHRSAARARAVSEARRAAGAKGGIAKRDKQIASRESSNLLEVPGQQAQEPPVAVSSNLLDGASNLLETPGGKVAKPRRKAASKLLDPASKLLDEGLEPYALIPAPPAAPRSDALQLCERLAQRMIENECPSPTITKAWLDAARLMLDKDKRDFQKAMNLIDWCQQDGFWRGNIRSMPTFREKYDQLRLQATREYRIGNYVPEGMTREEATRAKAEQRISTTEVAVAQLDIAYEKLKARMEGTNGSIWGTA